MKVLGCAATLVHSRLFGLLRWKKFAALRLFRYDDGEVEGRITLPVRVETRWICRTIEPSDEAVGAPQQVCALVATRSIGPKRPSLLVAASRLGCDS